MSMKPSVVIAILWVGSLALAAGVGRAQVQPQTVTPFVVTGADLGFRVEGRRGNTPVGVVVIRKDANSPWTPVEFTGRDLPRRLD
jgi:hypothetical protein